MENFEFPKGFLWGAATSAHQVEGGNCNDWSIWEKENALRLAAFAQGKPWPRYLLNLYPSPLDPNNYISGRACDHYNRFGEDFDIAKQLGHNAHRFSIEWSRIEPEEGKFDEKEIEHYQKVVDALRNRGIEPFVTLWHWTLPLWVRDQGGWENKKTVDGFVRYVNKVSRSLENVVFWVTINEPLVYASHSYLKGDWPPQRKSFFVSSRVTKNLTAAHKKSYTFLKRNNPSAKVGVAKNIICFDGLAAPFTRWWWNYAFLNHIRNYQDFIGVNDCNHIRNFKFYRKENKNKTISDMGWEIYPEGIYRILKGLKKYKRPIYITENGVADARDIYREKFIKDHLHHTLRAMREGVDVRGYFHWSLLDNFEWDKGFWPRFGLVEVDYKTMERKIRPSALEYAKICKESRL